MAKAWLIVPLLVLYLTNLGGVGFLLPDEPRYASIGREMARSGDWITPRLDGDPWFEKPPLLYWLTAAGHLAHLPDEWAARLPVALISLAFLMFFFGVVEREFSERVAMAACGILATSALWMAYSFVAVTDLPMSAALGAATLIALFDTRPKRGWLAGVWLGVAILAKGFVPVVLFGPVFLVARGKRLAILAATVLVAAPWYVAVQLRNPGFWNDFFWKHHVDRFLRPALEHPQAWWFYLPVLLGLLFPWTPLIGLLVRPKTYQDVRTRFLLVFLAFGFVFFSWAVNKLPGYILPLMPALAIVLAVGLDGVGRSVEAAVPGRAQAWWLAACALLLLGIPTIARVLPDALLTGISHVSISWGVAVPFFLAAGLVFVLAWTGRAQMAVLTAALAAAVGAGYLKTSTFPVLDERVSVRAFWVAHREEVAGACAVDIRRDWWFELNYYAGRKLGECSGREEWVVGGRERLEIYRGPGGR